MKKRIEKPWGREEILYNKDGVTFKTICIKKGQSTSLHYHKHKEETLVAVTECEVKIGDKLRSLFNGNSVTITPGKVHSFIAKNAPAILAEMSYGEDVDIIRLADRYEGTRKPGRPRKVKETK